MFVVYVSVYCNLSDIAVSVSVDFVHLLFVCQQTDVFEIERDHKRMTEFGGGDNDRITLQPGPFFFVSPNPVRDFVLRHVYVAVCVVIVSQFGFIKY